MTVTSNSIKMQGTNDVEPEVVVTASQTTICSGASITFTAYNKSGNRSPSYQWLVNGNATGSNSTTFTTNSLTNGAKVECMMKVPQCGGGTTKDYSDPITITVNQAANPSVSITTSSASICKGNPVTFSATAKESGNDPVFQWKVNGTDVSGNGASFSTSGLQDGDVVNCVVQPTSSTCGNATSVVSNTIKMKVDNLIVPSVSVWASANEICSGETVTFTADPGNAGAASSFQWQLNGTNVGGNQAVYITNNLADGDKVNCILTVNGQCSTSSSAQSNTLTLSIKPLPEIDFDLPDTAVWRGQQVKINSTVSGNVASYQWTPAGGLQDAQSLSPTTIPLITSTTYQLMVTSDDGCSVTKSAAIEVTPGKLLIPNSFTPNRDGFNDVFRIPPGSNLKLKEFAVFDRWGNKIFSTSDISKGWDGTNKGIPVNPGTFVYSIGGSNDSGDVFLKGMVILLR